MQPFSRLPVLCFAALLCACGGAQTAAAPPVNATLRPQGAAARVEGGDRNASPAASGALRPASVSGAEAPPSVERPLQDSPTVTLAQLEARIAQDRSSSFGSGGSGCDEVLRASRSICEAARAVCELDPEQRCQRAGAQCNEAQARCHERCGRCER